MLIKLKYTKWAHSSQLLHVVSGTAEFIRIIKIKYFRDYVVKVKKIH